MAWRKTSSISSRVRPFDDHAPEVQRELVRAQRDNRAVGMYLFVALACLVVSFGLSRLVGRLQKRLAH